MIQVQTISRCQPQRQKWEQTKEANVVGVAKRCPLFPPCSPLFRRLIMECIKLEAYGVDKQSRPDRIRRYMRRSERHLPEEKVGRESNHLQSNILCGEQLRSGPYC